MPVLATLLGMPKWLKLALAAALAVGALALWLNHRDSENRELGATQQREADLRETVNNVEKANEAAETVRRDADAARADCLRDAINPANC